MKYKEFILDWIEKTTKKEKQGYLHFDKKVDLSKDILINDENGKQYKNPQSFFEDFFHPKKLQKRGFWPLVHFRIKEKKIKKSKLDKSIYYNFKSRDIFYASHYDSLVYSFYSYMLSSEYEKRLENNLDSSVLAYRMIQDSEGIRKNNIYFARDAFSAILDIRDCEVYAFDVSKFFDSLDRDYLNIRIKELIGDLTPDWINILNSITDFSYIEKYDIRKFNLIEKGKSKISVERFKAAKKEHPIRYKDSKNPKFVKKNISKLGIAQGTPISGMLANIYMFEFDSMLKSYVDGLNGKFYRYSDDVFIIIPTSSNKSKDDVLRDVEKYIKLIHLNLKKEKTELVIFQGSVAKESYSYQGNGFIKDDNYIRPIQYLGFTFNGRTIGIRNKTLSRHYIRMKESVAKVARLIGSDDLKNDTIYLGNLKKKFTPVSKYRTRKGRYSNFYGYVIQASLIMGPILERINKPGFIKEQMARYIPIFQRILKKKSLSK